ncbi:MAG: acetyltransferase [Lachnospiraceae bacterium]|nr:acetyltransferase [Lachnospiraceae bacterium]
MKEKFIIYGAGGHGKVIADIALLNGYREIAFFDDDIDIKECAGFPVVGRITGAESIVGDKIIAIGNSHIRERIQNNVKSVTLVHPDAIIGSRVTIGEGSAVMAGAIINADAKIGKGCIINTSSSVDHDCVVGDFSHVAVGAHLCGTVTIGKHTWVGAGAIILNNVSICNNVIIGAGAVVVSDIKEEGTYIGVPAKKMMKTTGNHLCGGGYNHKTIANGYVAPLEVAA